MHNIYNSLRYFIVLGFIFFSSCKKDVDKVGPVIDIYAPIENQTFNVLDNITVSGNIIDETQLTSITVSLVDANQTAAHIGQSVTVSSPSTVFSITYPLDNISLLTGVYYIKVVASDGVNESKKYMKINLIEVPKVLEKIIVVSNSSSSKTNWGYIDTSFSAIIPITFFTGDYIGSSASSQYQQITNCGNYTGSYSIYDIKNNALKHTIPASISSNPYFTGYTSSGKNTYLARYDEFIKGYDFTGAPVYNATTINGYYGKHFTFNNGIMISEQQNKISADKILVTYFATGVPDVQTTILQDVVAFAEKDNSNVFVFGNTSGQATIQLFDRINNNLWNPYPFSLPTGALLSATKINSDTYLIAHSNGTIYKYQYQTSSLTTYISGYVAKQLKYDSYFNKVYIAENNKIITMDYTSANIEQSVNSPENILDFHLMYNR